ncbi:MAG: hypothetical protein AB1589_07715 [Cyanobacteriota bacterium]
MQLTRASDRIIWQSCQPESLKNDSYGYCLYVGEGGLDWSRFPYTLNRKYYLVISVTPTYGHYKEYSFTSELEDVDTYVKESKVEWSAEGLTFIEKSGHRLFVPRKWFSKGR